MFDKFIDPSLRPEWLPNSQPISMTDASICSHSADLARKDRVALKKGKKG